MHGPGRDDYPMTKEFVEVATARARIVLEHIQAMHMFRMVMAFAVETGGTRVTWRTRIKISRRRQRRYGVSGR